MGRPMKNRLIVEFDKRFSKTPKTQKREFRSGDTVRVHYKIQEGADKKKFRIQVYEGVVIRFRKGMADSSFTVRKISANGVGVERCFPFYSSYIDKVEVVARGIVRQSRLFYLRDLSGKAARIRNRYFAKGLGGLIQNAEEASAETPSEGVTSDQAAAPATEETHGATAEHVSPTKENTVKASKDKKQE